MTSANEAIELFESHQFQDEFSHGGTLKPIYVYIMDIERFVRTEDGYDVLNSQLSFVKMPGSERIRKTGASGQRLKEAQMIARSLASLGNVIQCIIKNSNFIPYRDSKITYVMKHAFGGNCDTLFIGNICSSEWNRHETLSTLRFLHRIKMVKNFPKININSGQSLLAQLAYFDQIINEPEINKEEDHNGISFDSRTTKNSFDLIEEKCNELIYLLISIVKTARNNPNLRKKATKP